MEIYINIKIDIKYIFGDAMGIIDSLKTVFESSKDKAEESDNYLKLSKSSMKQAHSHITEFLDKLKDFQPARRHHELYTTEIIGRIVNIKEWIFKGILFIDRKIKGDEFAIKNSNIRSAGQLKDMVDMWINIIRDENSETDNGVIKKLQTEMWSEERKLRGFPVPKDKDSIIKFLDDTRKYLKEASFSLENYNLTLTL